MNAPAQNLPKDDPAALEAALLAAHAASDGVTLARLYTQAADRAEADGDIDATCFFLTYAYVYALQTGLEAADDLHRRLVAYGREE